MESREISRIREQHLSNQWPQFLESIEIRGLHGFSGEAITFGFPVTAIVGENGSGKSTILKAIACCYDKSQNQKEYYPSKLFINTHWDQIRDVRIAFRIRRCNETENSAITKPSERWNYPDKKFIRPVYIFDIGRTLPMDSMAGYAKVAKLATNEISTESLVSDYLGHLKHILSRNYETARFVVPDVDVQKKVGLLRHGGFEISQFHQGAGEDTTQDLMMALQNMPNNSLILIDEVEASLHPRAQRRLVRFLLWFSRQKRAQIVMTTHSSAIFEELPREARILLLAETTGKSIIYGASSEFALTKLDDETTPSVTLFVEDYEAKILLREIIRNHEDGHNILPLVSIQPVGPADVVQMLGRIGADNKLPYKSIAFIDGDYDETVGCYKLPGNEAPERVVFGCFHQNRWRKLDERFGIGAGSLFNYLNDSITDPDHHNWTKIVGDRIKIGSDEIWELMTNEWCKLFLQDEDKNRIVRLIQEKLH